MNALRFALREPRVASGEAVLHLIDTGVDGPTRFHGSVLGGDRAAVAETLRRTGRSEGGAWAVVFVVHLSEQARTWLVCDCGLGQGPGWRFATELVPTADGVAAGRLVSIGPGEA